MKVIGSCHFFVHAGEKEVFIWFQFCLDWVQLNDRSRRINCRSSDAILFELLEILENSHHPNFCKDRNLTMIIGIIQFNLAGISLIIRIIA